MLGFLRHPTFVLIIALCASALLVGSVMPAPSNWTRGPTEKVADLRVATGIHWHPLSSAWSIDQPDVQPTTSKWLNWGAIIHNALSLTSASQTFSLALQTGNSVLVEQHTSTGRGSWLGTDKTIVLVLREIPPGEYSLHARILDENGAELASNARPLTLISGES